MVASRSISLSGWLISRTGLRGPRPTKKRPPKITAWPAENAGMEKNEAGLGDWPVRKRSEKLSSNEPVPVAFGWLNAERSNGTKENNGYQKYIAAQREKHSGFLT